MKGPTVDASIPHLLPEQNAFGGWRLIFERAIRSRSGLRALWRTTGAVALPHISSTKHISLPIQIGPMVWNDRYINIDGVFPQTLSTALVGKDAKHVVNHSASIGRIINNVDTGIDHTQQLFVLYDNYKTYQNYTCVCLDSRNIKISQLKGGLACHILLPIWTVIDLATDRIIWLRLRGMARRGKHIECARMNTARRAFDFAGAFAVCFATLCTAISIFLMLGYLGFNVTDATLVAMMGSCFATGVAYGHISAFDFSISDDAMVLPPWLMSKGGNI